MWAIRILTGKQTGKVFDLKEGKNAVGRSKDNDIVLPSQGVSKNHALVEVINDKVIITDLDSRNGTFINGLQAKAQKLNPGDKIGFHDILVEFGLATQFKQIAYNPHQPQQGFYQTNPMLNQPEPHLQGHANTGEVEPGDQAATNMGQAKIKSNFGKQAEDYLNDIILPGVYKLPAWLEFKYVYALFIIGFVFMVTALSSIPMIRILKSSVEKESRDHAITIAEYMAQYNQSAVAQGLQATIDTDRFRVGGATELYIVGRDGIIIAPARDAGRAPEQSIVQRFREVNRPMVDNMNDETIVAMAPIPVRDPQTGLNTIGAYSVVVYDMGALAVNDERVLSLLVQTLFIALLIGGVWFFFSYKLVEWPFRNLNRQLDEVLQGKKHQVQMEYQFAPLQKLISYINSSISRMSDSEGGMDQHIQMDVDRSAEMKNLVEVVGFPALTIDANTHQVMAVNSVFSLRTGIDGENMVNNPIDSVTDQAFKLNVLDLMSQVQQDPSQMAVNHIEFSGIAHEVMAQGIQGNNGMAFYLVVLIPQEEGVMAG